MLQPVAAAVMAYIVIASTSPPHFNLEGPSIADLGALGIFAGLAMVILDAYRAQQKTHIQESQTTLLGEGAADSDPDR